MSLGKKTPVGKAEGLGDPAMPPKQYADHMDGMAGGQLNE